MKSGIVGFLLPYALAVLGFAVMLILLDTALMHMQGLGLIFHK